MYYLLYRPCCCAFYAKINLKGARAQKIVYALLLSYLDF